MIVVGIQLLFVGFLNLSSSEDRFLFFLLLKSALSFICLEKSSNCLFYVSLLIVFCVGMKFKFLLKSLKVFLGKIEI